MTLRIACRVAMLTVASVLAAPLGVVAQSLVCLPIVRGDTAASLARRLTGDAAAAYTPRFQIRIPSRGLVVPKSRYQRLSPQWQACAVREIVVRRTASLAATRPLPAPSLRLATPDVVAARDLAVPAAAPVRTSQPRPPASAHQDVQRAALFGVGVALLLFASTLLVRLAPSPAAPQDLQRAGEAFVAAFVRPLIDPGVAVPPIAARFRFVRRSQHLEIHLAPNGGRRYPNLRDHKKNVEYDVQRVLSLLGPRVVVGSRVRAQGKWVIVPIRLIDQKRTGAT
jgi:hypothetical protein